MVHTCAYRYIHVYTCACRYTCLLCSSPVVSWDCLRHINYEVHNWSSTLIRDMHSCVKSMMETHQHERYNQIIGDKTPSKLEVLISYHLSISWPKNNLETMLTGSAIQFFFPLIGCWLRRLKPTQPVPKKIRWKDLALNEIWILSKTAHASRVFSGAIGQSSEK